MDIAERVAAIRTAMAVETGTKEIEAIEIHFDDLQSATARTGDGGDAIVLDRAKAEASSEEHLRFVVRHELAHAHLMKNGTGNAGREFTTFVADDDPCAALLQG